MQALPPTLKKKSSAEWRGLRAFFGFCLLAFYLLAEFALSPAAICGLACASGGHEVSRRGNTVVMHHGGAADETHRGFTKMLVACSHSNPLGDHVITGRETDAYEEPRDWELLDSSDSSSPCCSMLFSNRPQAAMLPCLAPVGTDDAGSRQIALVCWRTVCLVI